MFESILNKIIKKSPRKPSRTYMQSNHSWNIKLDREEFRGTVVGHTPVSLKKDDYLVLFTHDEKGTSLFKVKKIKTIIRKESNSVGYYNSYSWEAKVTWVPSKECGLCKRFFEAEAIVDECPYCKVEAI
jgi:hypothetical protein